MSGELSAADVVRDALAGRPEPFTMPGELVSEATSRYLVNAQARGDVGGQMVYRFPNGWGASVIRYVHHITLSDGTSTSTGTYGAEDGLFELGVLRWPDGVDDPAAGELDQDHPLVADDGGVLGYLTAAAVEHTLVAIMQGAPPAGGGLT